MAETATPVTATEYAREESDLHRLYKTGSPSYAAVFERYGKALSASRAGALAAQHGTTLEALAEEGLSPYPAKRGETDPVPTYGTAHLFSALGY